MIQINQLDKFQLDTGDLKKKKKKYFIANDHFYCLMMPVGIGRLEKVNLC